MAKLSVLETTDTDEFMDGLGMRPYPVKLQVQSSLASHEGTAASEPHRGASTLPWRRRWPHPQKSQSPATMRTDLSIINSLRIPSYPSLPTSSSSPFVIPTIEEIIGDTTAHCHDGSSESTNCGKDNMGWHFNSGQFPRVFIVVRFWQKKFGAYRPFCSSQSYGHGSIPSPCITSLLTTLLRSPPSHFYLHLNPFPGASFCSSSSLRTWHPASQNTDPSNASPPRYYTKPPCSLLMGGFLLSLWGTVKQLYCAMVSQPLPLKVAK